MVPNSLTSRGVCNRRETRIPLRRSLKISPCSGSETMAAELFDCSSWGVGMFLKKALPCGEQFMIELRGSAPRIALYTVRNCKREENGFRVGAEFEGYIVAPPATTRESIVDALMRM